MRIDQEELMVGGMTTSNFHFSAMDVARLSASEYTLVAIVLDQSGSTFSFQDQQIKAIEEIVEACRKSPRAENLMIRLVTFNNHVYEEHGFTLLSAIKTDNYKQIKSPNGMTALYDATISAVESVKAYGKKLMEEDFDANAIVFVITDGDDNASINGTTDVKKAINSAISEECVESIRTVLIGLNTSSATGLSSYLQDFKNKSEIEQYIDVADASAKSLAKLADFVSKSISAQSQALGTGGPSKALSF